VDLNDHVIGQRAFQQATHTLKQPNTKPLPNPWAIKAKSIDTGWPPATPQDLVDLLYHYASNAETAELLLQGAGSQLRFGAVPLIEQAAVANKISRAQKEFLLDTIRRMG
jgi:hypothetical protein